MCLIPPPALRRSKKRKGHQASCVQCEPCGVLEGEKGGNLDLVPGAENRALSRKCRDICQETLL